MPDLDVGLEERVLGPDDEDFISEHLTEAEVFVKYGLADRAIEQLGAIVERYPWHLASRQKLRDVFLEEGSRARAANESAAMARILFESGDGAGAQAAIAEARSIDAACPAIAEVEAILGGTERVAPPSHLTPPRRQATPPRETAAAEESDLIIEEEETIEESRATPSASGPAEEDLQEFDFYLSQGMHSEAAACLSRMESAAGPHPALEERREALGRTAPEAAPAPAPEPAESLEAGSFLEEPQAPAAAEAAEEEIPESVVEEVVEPSAALVAPAAASPGGGGGAADFFDLASEMDPDLFAAQDTTDERKALEGIEASPEGHSLDEIVTAFKKGIEQQVGAEDFETHYNLGIAYKEMGLLEEAIGEFQFASKDPKLLPDCCSMLGICFRDKGMPSLAVKWYRKGLDAVSSGGDEEKLNGIRFDLAEVLDQMGELRQALDIYVEIYGADSRYRDVAGRIKDLKARMAG
jgi:tetratricopeptide (TPR) repeat protein